MGKAVDQPAGLGNVELGGQLVCEREQTAFGEQARQSGQRHRLLSGDLE